MYITKRDGTKEEMQFDKISKRVRQMSKGLTSEIDPHKLAIKVMESLFDGVTSSQIDTELAEMTATMSTHHPDYGQLAANIAVSNLQKNTKGDFADTMSMLYHFTNPKTGLHSPIVSKEVYNIAVDFAWEINNAIDFSRDFSYDFFGFKTLERSYLLKIDKKAIERPQHMLMRVSLGIHGRDLKEAFKTYDMMSLKLMTHATPTLFNSATPRPQMSSCFLIDMQSDSINGIYDTLKTTALISKDAGGIGLTAHKIRATGSYIASTNGISNGIVPMLKVFNETARYVDQGGGKRKGSFAIYLEPWHADIFDFLDLKKNVGKEEMRARDLFYAMWNNDLFMKRVEANEHWSLMCPHESPGLADVHSEEFDELYISYENQGKFKAQIKARELWEKIIVSQMETGTPYMLYKDASNSKSNQKNLGTIKSSNLCAEIIEYTDPGEVAVCNLASIALPMFVKSTFGKLEVDYDKLYQVAYQSTRNLNKVIDRNFYPVDQARVSNIKHRPIGLGVQGLADLFFKLKLPFESQQARQINKDVHETIYFASLTASNDLVTSGELKCYSSFEGSPLSRGEFQFDLWNVSEEQLSNRYNWNELRARIIESGLANSLVTALMPTASTGQILGNTECFEPITSNMYTRRTLAGEYIVSNKYLIVDLIDLGLWNDDMRQMLMADNGSVLNLPIPDNLKEIYKTVWEMSMKSIIDMSADRGIFIDQSQSLNLFMADPNFQKLSSMHFYAWKKGLKTGMYYLRSKSAVNAKKFTVTQETIDLMKAKLAKIAEVNAKEDLECDDCENSDCGKCEEFSAETMTAAEFKAMVQKSKGASESDNLDEECLMCGS